jgi:hypothetical protein
MTEYRLEWNRHLLATAMKYGHAIVIDPDGADQWQGRICLGDARSWALPIELGDRVMEAWWDDGLWWM